MKRAAVVVAVLLIAGCTNVKFTRVPTTLELMRILDLHIWWMPLPEGKQWTIDMADAQPLGTKTAGLLHAGRESMISMRDLDGRHYEFTIEQRGGESRGTIDVCEGAESMCEGQWGVEFFNPPKCNTGCSAYIAGELTSISSPAKRQIILSLADELTIRPGAGTVVTPLPR